MRASEVRQAQPSGNPGEITAKRKGTERQSGRTEQGWRRPGWSVYGLRRRSVSSASELNEVDATIKFKVGRNVGESQISVLCLFASVYLSGM
jgi:hypothetical protein